MTTYRLHYFPESGNSYKLALMLTLCGQTFEPDWTDFGAGVTRTPEWRATINVMGEIPVLEEDGVRFTQTAPILLQLAERYGRYAATVPKKNWKFCVGCFGTITSLRDTWQPIGIKGPSPEIPIGMS